MNKIISSTFAKIVAVFLLVICAVTFLLSAAAIYVLSEADVYFDDGTKLRYLIYSDYIYEVRDEIMESYVKPYHTESTSGYMKTRYSYLMNRYSPENSNVAFSVKYGDGRVFMSNYSIDEARIEYSEEYTLDIYKNGDRTGAVTFKKEYGEGTVSIISPDGFSDKESQRFIFTARIRKELTVADKLYYIMKVTDFFTVNRYLLIVVCGVSFLLALIIFIFLVCGAGHKKGTDEICLEPLDEIPLDIYALFAGFVSSVLVLFMYAVYRYYGILNPIISVTASFVCLIMIGLMCLSFILTFAARFKYGKWWKNTVVFRVIFTLYRMCRWVVFKIAALIESLPLFWKTAFVFIALAVFEIILFFSAERGTFLLWWGVIKIVVGFVLFFTVIDMSRIKKGGKEIASGNIEYKIDTKGMYGDFKKHASHLNSISDGIQKAVNDKMKSERLKTELITNVSHDLKTPLTSIVNYVDLMKKEDIQPEKAKEYLEVLDRQSKKLQKLTVDLLEASKASTGSIKSNPEMTDINVFLSQIEGEYAEKAEKASLELVVKEAAENPYIFVDGRLLWRVFDNLMNNICKYTLENTRVYVSAHASEKTVTIEFKNISRYPLDISSDELMERFVRGDKSRNTEGSGLGLSIAKSLAELLKGKLDIVIDGDLFKAVVEFDRYYPDEDNGDE